MRVALYLAQQERGRNVTLKQQTHYQRAGRAANRQDRARSKTQLPQ